MLAWFARQVTPTWTRKTRWTPLLQNQREFQRCLAKERSRVERNGRCFGIIILRLENLHSARTQTVLLAKLLHRRLRETDEKGHLGFGRLGVMLPETDAMDTESVMLDLLKEAADNDLRVEGEAFVYPDRESDTKRPGKPGQLVPREGATSHLPLSLMVPDYPRWKRSLDVLGAAAGLVISLPLLAIAAILIRATSAGPVLFRQHRTGFLGEPFTIYKLRTMVDHAEKLKGHFADLNERDGPAFKMRRDPRITKIGHILRITGMDELPQLYNVLRGEMSLVGPRPLPVEEAAQCQQWHRRRQDVKPGLTCYWQLLRSRNIPFGEWMRLDLRYARSLSLRLDLKLIVSTFTSVLTGRIGH